MTYELSIIIPTYNESENVSLLYKKILENLDGINFEVVFVDDDSPDGTSNVVNELIASYPNVRLIKRINKRGLSSACIDGFASSNAKYLAVIDADLQHDPQVLRTLFNTISKDNLDIVVASRFAAQSEINGLSSLRKFVSNVGNKIASLIAGAKLSDPLSGFFMTQKAVIDKVIYNLSGKGFKILLDIFSSCKLAKIKLRFAEVPITFHPRNSGESKLDSFIMLEFLLLVLDKIFGKFIPVRFIMFIIVGLSGLVLQIFLLAIMLKFMHLDFSVSQTTATIIVMTSNFFFNNIFTYRDKRLHGIKIIPGLLSFYLSCSIGAFINVTVATYLYNIGVVWFLSSLVGCIISATWNYAITSFTTWRKTDV